MFSSPARIHAPEINRPKLEWLNVEKPLSLQDVRGKIVILDFWTFCCINCIQILPTLRKLEETFHKEIVVIGVHTPKFTAEKDFENLRLAAARYDIRHPIIHDPHYVLWGQYNVHAWPTLVFIDPEGYVIGTSSGEPDPLHLLNGVRDLIETFEQNSTLKVNPFPWAEPELCGGQLSFPGKIKPLPGPEKKWLVADSGHHQIALFDDKGSLLQRFGNGLKGCMDGPADKATFNSPQGLIATDDAIYVADTGNHAIRKIDRKTNIVSTLAGTGERGHLLVNKFEKAVGRALASPWDLEIKNNILFFANAGTHQIGGIDLAENHLRLVAGNGSEGLRDGNPLTAELAQPSALSFNADLSRLYFADSETSSIRMLDLKVGLVRSIVGAGLFDFGNQNGNLVEARFQHPLGCAALTDSLIAVADSYNNSLRLIDLDAGQVRDIGGETGLNCLDGLCLPLSEPAGLWADGEKRLLISDTNNHRIVEVRPHEKTTKTFI